MGAEIFGAEQAQFLRAERTEQDAALHRLAGGKRPGEFENRDGARGIVVRAVHDRAVLDAQMVEMGGQEQDAGGGVGAGQIADGVGGLRASLAERKVEADRLPARPARQIGEGSRWQHGDGQAGFGIVGQPDPEGAADGPGRAGLVRRGADDERCALVARGADGGREIVGGAGIDHDRCAGTDARCGTGDLCASGDGAAGGAAQGQAGDGRIPQRQAGRAGDEAARDGRLLDIAGHAWRGLQAVSLELGGDIGGGDRFVAGRAAATGEFVTGEEGLVGADPVGADLLGG